MWIGHIAPPRVCTSQAQPAVGADPPWHSRYASPEPHQHGAAASGGQGTALPLAASVVAYSARRDGESGEVRSEAAKAS